MRNYLLRIKGTDQVITEDEKILVFVNPESANMHRLTGDIPDGTIRENLEVESVEVEE